jgi:hypothetical protein
LHDWSTNEKTGNICKLCGYNAGNSNFDKKQYYKKYLDAFLKVIQNKKYNLTDRNVDSKQEKFDDIMIDENKLKFPASDSW